MHDARPEPSSRPGSAGAPPGTPLRPRSSTPGSGAAYPAPAAAAGHPAGAPRIPRGLRDLRDLLPTRSRGIGVNRLHPIGSGGQSTVYSGVDPQLGTVAVKVFHLASSEAVEQCRRELGILRRLRDIPAVVTVHRGGTTDTGEPYFVMQHLSGGSLQDLIDRDGAMDWRDACRYVVSAARVIGRAHRAGVVHADIKPSNILLDAAGAPFVSDFGVAEIINVDRRESPADAAISTYAAPETLGQAVATEASDIYALGATLVGLISGRPPFQSTTATPGRLRDRVADDLPPTLSGFGAPVRLSQVAWKAMAKRPEDRYASAEELAIAISRCMSGEGPRAADIAPVATPADGGTTRSAGHGPDEAAPAGSRRWWHDRRLLALAPVVVLGVAGAASLLTGPDEIGPSTVAVEADGSGDYPDLEAAALTVAPGSTIVLGPGVHELDTTLELTGPITVTGTGQAETVVAGAGTGPVIEGTGPDIALSALTVDYRGTADAVDVVSLSDATIRIEEVTVSGGTGDGLRIGGGSGGTIDASSFTGNDGSGMVVADTSSVDIDASSAVDNRGSGFTWTDSATGGASDCRSELNGTDGFLVDGSASPELVTCVATGNRATGFHWTGSAGGEARSNTADGNSTDGYLVTGDAAPDLTDDTATSNGDAGFVWAEQAGGGGSDNSADSNRGDGFVVADSASVTLSRCSATGNDGAGMVWRSSGTASWNGCRAEGNGGDGYAIEAATGTLDLLDNDAVGNGINGFTWAAAVIGLVDGNTASDNTATGFDLAGSPDSPLDNNGATGNGGYGFVAPDLTELAGRGNTADGNRSGDLVTPADAALPDDQEPGDDPADASPTPAPTTPSDPTETPTTTAPADESTTTTTEPPVGDV